MHTSPPVSSRFQEQHCKLATTAKWATSPLAFPTTPLSTPCLWCSSRNDQETRCAILGPTYHGSLFPFRPGRFEDLQQLVLRARGKPLAAQSHQHHGPEAGVTPARHASFAQAAVARTPQKATNLHFKQTKTGKTRWYSLEDFLPSTWKCRHPSVRPRIRRWILEIGAPAR